MLPEQKLNSAITLVEKTLGIHSGVDVILEDHQGSNITRVQLRNNLRERPTPQLSYRILNNSDSISSTCDG